MTLFLANEWLNDLLEAQVEGLSRFATTMLMPSPGKLLAKIPGVTKGIKALGKIAKHELNALRAATKTAKTEIVVLNGVKVSKPIYGCFATNGRCFCKK